MSRKPLSTFICLLCLTIALSSARTDNSLAVATLHERVTCRLQPDEAYALYLPGQYRPDQSWPILISLDPGGNALVPMKLLQACAEEKGYILICPYKVQNGPPQPAVIALNAVWQDVETRFSIDKRRVYAIGFSGGARMATIFHQVTQQPLTGILACGAGLWPGIKLEELADTLYFGFAGYADFNYAEMTNLQKEMNGRKRPCRFLFSDYLHRWPEESLCRRAIDWFTIQAIQDGLIPEPPGLLESYYHNELQASKARISQNEPYFAARELAELAASCRSLIGPSRQNDLLHLQTECQDMPEYKRFKKEEENRLRRENATLKTLSRVFGQLRQDQSDELVITGLLHELGLKQLNKVVAESQNRYETGLARRLLSTIADAANTQVQACLAQGRRNSAESFSQVLCKVYENSRRYPIMLYNHACIQAVSGKKKQALRSLKEAVEHGFSDSKLFAQDPDLASLRETEEYQTLLQTVTSASPKQ